MSPILFLLSGLLSLYLWLRGRWAIRLVAALPCWLSAAPANSQPNSWIEAHRALGRSGTVDIGNGTKLTVAALAPQIRHARHHDVPGNGQ